MKRLYATTYILMALDVLVASVLIHLMPDQVPVHFNGANEPDRLGSKYEFLVAILFPLCGVFVVMGSKNAPIGKERRWAWGAVAFEVFVLGWILFYLTKALLYDGAPFPEPDLDASAGPPSSAARSASWRGTSCRRRTATPSSACARRGARPARRRGGAASASAGTRASQRASP